MTAWLPARCLLCGRLAGEAIVCPACEGKLPRLPAAHCPVCASPRQTAADEDGLPCGACLGSPPPFDATRASYAYASPVNELIRQMKFRSRLAGADFFASRMPLPPEGVDLLIPVPLAPERLAERGFNQALEIARGLASAHGLPIDASSLTRVRATPHQIGLSWRARAGNLRDAFACNARFDGLHLAVVDDVMTSGATLAEIARTLKGSGATRVTNLVAARTLREGHQA